MICRACSALKPINLNNVFLNSCKVLVALMLLQCSMQGCFAAVTADQLRKAEADLEKGNYGTILKSLPNDDPRALVLKGRALLSIDSGEAGKYLGHAAEIAPHDPEVLAWKGAGLIKYKFYPLAIDSLNKAIALYPKNADLHS